MSVTVRVFDPAQCCPTGVCGPSVDPKLVRFAADLDWLAGRGVKVARFNLAQQPGAFVESEPIKAILEKQGEAGLPAVEVNGEIKSTGVYPTREELAAWASVEAPAPSIFTEAVAELVAIGAAIASNCEPCFKAHFDKARKLGVSREDMLRAVIAAQMVKEEPARSVFDLAQRHLRREADAGASPTPKTSLRTVQSCCEPSGGTGTGPDKKGGCC